MREYYRNAELRSQIRDRAGSRNRAARLRRFL